MNTILGAIIPIFLLLGIGYLAVLKRIVDKAHIQGMGRYVINIALPALVIQALLQRPLSEVFNVPYLLVYGLGSGLAFAITFGMVTLRGNAPLERRAMYALGTSASNSGFVGYPVVVMVAVLLSLWLDHTIQPDFDRMVVGAGIAPPARARRASAPTCAVISSPRSTSPQVSDHA